MSVQVTDNKYYKKCTLSEDASIFNGFLDNHEIDVDILRRLSKDLGFSYDLYNTLNDIDPEAAKAMVISMSTHSKHPEILLLIDKENNSVLNYSLESERAPLLNSEFIKRVSSLVGTSDSVSLSEVYYHKDDSYSSVVIKKNDPIIIEEKYEGKESNFIEYNIGVLLVNDEVNAAYSKLVLYVNDQPLYLPASYYNTTTSRYKRSTSSSSEALEVLVLKIIDDLRENALHQKIYDLHYRYRANKYIYSSYEEYNTVLRTMRKIPTIIEDNSYLESLLSKYEEFEKKYVRLEDQKSSYIWRCTALSNITVGALVDMTTRIMSELSAPPVEYTAIRELLGSYISTNCIAEEIAKEDIN